MLDTFQHPRTQLNAPIATAPERYPNNRNKIRCGGFPSNWVYFVGFRKQRPPGAAVPVDRGGDTLALCASSFGIERWEPTWDTSGIGSIRHGGTSDKPREVWFRVGSSEKTRIRCGEVTTQVGFVWTPERPSTWERGSSGVHRMTCETRGTGVDLRITGARVLGVRPTSSVPTSSWV
ncbi:hypothetical protein BHE74_00037956 [Ensete ventricosum]|nr:hypothetical protein BHE74_00037956 [Ensete ventricosum]